MKKNLLFLPLAVLAFGSMSAQDNDKAKEAQDVAKQGDTYNKWTIEASVGQSKGTRPYTAGYFSSNPNKYFGTIDLNYYNAGVRYMFSPRFGVKVDGSFDKLENNKITTSLPFEVDQWRLGIQGVINGSRLLNLEERIGRFGLLVHAGLQFAWVTPQLDTPGVSNVGRTEHNLGVMFGVSPTFRVFKKFSIVGDFSTLANFRQHFAWDGHYAADDQNLFGTMLMGSIGLTYSIGSDDIHGDWAIINPEIGEDLADLDRRVGELETMLNDADKDGVPDYLDTEPNSIAGSAVDTKGRMVDLNKNGVPDEFEKYVATNYANKADMTTIMANANDELIKRLINEGYVTTYFDFNKTNPTNVSTEGIDFIRTYMKNNPSATIEIIGNADEIGKTTYNYNLANKRAESVKAILVKSGIEANRLNIISKGEDTSVDVDSPGARKLVRRVIFQVK